MTEPNIIQCPHCKGFLVEPIFDLDYTATLLGIKVTTLRRFLSTGPGKNWPPRYRFLGTTVRKRVLFLSEVRVLQQHFVRATRRVQGLREAPATGDLAHEG